MSHIPSILPERLLSLALYPAGIAPQGVARPPVVVPLRPSEAPQDFETSYMWRVYLSADAYRDILTTLGSYDVARLRSRAVILELLNTIILDLLASTS